MSAAPFASLNLAGHVGDDPASVDVNRGRLAALVGVRADRLAVMDAVHGGVVQQVHEPGVVRGVDALVTQEPGLAIVALGADCVPLALVGDDGRTIAVVHCGWRGLAADVVGAAVLLMQELGTGISTAVVGPAVCGSCYPVPVDRAQDIAARCAGPVADAAIVRCVDGQPGIDVRLGVVARLGQLGVRPSALVRVGGCTVEEPGLFSHRRDGTTGRQGVAACLVDPARMVAR